MAVDEHSRHQLYNRVVEVLGAKEADILMAHLPPGGYSSLATKLDVLESERRTTAELKGHVWRVVLSTNIPTMAIIAGIAFGAANLA